MRGKTVLVVGQGAHKPRRIDAPLTSAGNRVVRAGSADEALARLRAGDVDLALVDHDTIREIPSLVDVTRGRIPVVALATRSQSEGLLEVVCDHGVPNLLARKPAEGETPVFDPGEVLVTVEKILRGDVFGIEKYLPGFGIEVESRVLTGADQREPAIERVREFVSRLGGGSHLSQATGIVADELITNAIYNAPRDADGTPRYASTSRREKVTLGAGEYVTLAMGSNGDKLAISVTDRFGAFTGETLRSALRRCLVEGDPVEQKEGGAGIGLYMVLSSCSQLVINVAPGACTEFIAIWDLDKRLRAVRHGGHSLHAFVAKGPGAVALRGDDAWGDDDPNARTPALERGGGARADGAGAANGAAEAGVPARDTHPEVGASGEVDADGSDRLSEDIDFDEETVTIVGEVYEEELTQHRERPAQTDSPKPPPPPPSGPPAPLDDLRDVLLLRPPQKPSLRDALAQIHHARTPSEAVTAALTYLCSRWPAAVLLVRTDAEYRSWCAAGEVYDWDALMAHRVRAERFEHLLSHSQVPVARMAPQCSDTAEQDMAGLLLGNREAASLLLSIKLESLGELVIFAAREPVERWHSAIPYERVLWQVFVRLQALLGDDR